MDQALDHSDALGHLNFIGRAQLEVLVVLEFLRTLAECVAQTFSKLEFGLALSSIPIGEALSAKVIDCRKKFLKLRDSKRDLLDLNGFGSGPLLFPCACSCHGCVEKV
jgi:hypothetical protein